MRNSMSAQAAYPYNFLVLQPPGHRGFRRALQLLIKQLAHTALSDAALPISSKETLFNLVSEYSVAAQRAAAIAGKSDIVVTLPNDSLVVSKRLLMMLYLDYLVFGYATFEVANDIVLYADPRQFNSISINPDGSPKVVLKGEDISHRIGVIARLANPFDYCRSVPELIPQTFLFFLSFHNKLFYELSPFRKPDVLIVTSETLSPDELAARRRRLIEQAEEDYGSLLLYTHGSEDRPQISDLSKSDTVLKDTEAIYNTQVRILRETCGLPTLDESSGNEGTEYVSYPLQLFFSTFEHELSRLLDADVDLTMTS